jgi:hypothetical protein
VFLAYPSPDPLDALHRQAGKLYTAYRRRQPENIRLAARTMWGLLESNAEVVTGSTFQQVMEANLAKLADRAARGVLKGAGDNR